MKIIGFNTKNEKQKVTPIDFSDLKDVWVDSYASGLVKNLCSFIDRTHSSGLSHKYGQFLFGDEKNSRVLYPYFYENEGGKWFSCGFGIEGIFINFMLNGQRVLPPMQNGLVHLNDKQQKELDRIGINPTGFEPVDGCGYAKFRFSSLPLFRNWFNRPLDISMHGYGLSFLDYTIGELLSEETDEKMCTIRFDIAAKRLYSMSDSEERHYLNALTVCVGAINYPMTEEINKLVKL